MSSRRPPEPDPLEVEIECAAPAATTGCSSSSCSTAGSRRVRVPVPMPTRRRSTDRDLEAVSHFSTEPAAENLEKDYPDAAAILWRAQGMRIVNAGKIDYYEAALRNFAAAKRAYLKAGQPDAWSAVVAEVRTAHHRKYGFMPGFEKLVAGEDPGDKPAFLERAKARWQF